MDLQDELAKARALLEATSVASSRFGRQLSRRDLETLSEMLGEAYELIERLKTQRCSQNLTAASIMLDQVRDFVLSQRPN